MILVYHHTAPEDAVPVGPIVTDGWKFRISPQGFLFHIAELKRRGYQFISLANLVETIFHNGKEPAKRVCITFDDGWRDNYEFAFPLLKKLGVPATFFMTTHHLEQKYDDPKKMTKQQLHELIDAGMTVGSHTRTHLILTKVSEKQAKAEIRVSKSVLEDILQQEVRFFAYPFGAFNNRIAEMVMDAGYVSACSMLSPAQNDRSSFFWLYRGILTENLRSIGDHCRLSPVLKSVLSLRAKWRLRRNLGGYPLG